MVTVVHGDDTLCGIKKKVLFASKFDLPEYTDDTKVVSVYLLYLLIFLFIFYLSFIARIVMF